MTNGIGWKSSKWHRRESPFHRSRRRLSRIFSMVDDDDKQPHQRIPSREFSVGQNRSCKGCLNGKLWEEERLSVSVPRRLGLE